MSESINVLEPKRKLPASVKNHDRSIDWSELSREFDGRLNLNHEWEVKCLIDRVRLILPQLSYVLIGGIERGDNPTTTDFEKDHVHIALRFKNRISLSSAKAKLGFGTIGGQYYLAVRKSNKFMTYKGWRDHHTKDETKVYPGQNILFEFGELPKDPCEFKTKKMDKYAKIIELAKAQKWKQIEADYPLDYIRMAGQLRVKYWRQSDDIDTMEHKQALWLWGAPGTGKSAIVHHLFGQDGKMYKKQLEDKWWDGFDIDHHNCYYLEDVDPEALKKIGIQRMKVWADHTGFAGDKKYGGLDIIRGQCIVTSNFTIDDCVYNHKGVESTLQAFHRRFRQVEIHGFLNEIGLRLVSKEKLKELKESGNADYGACFEKVNEIIPATPPRPSKNESECPGAPVKKTKYFDSDDERDFYEAAIEVENEYNFNKALNELDNTLTIN